MVRDFHSDIFGEKVFIFSSEDNPKEVQKILDSIYAKQEDNQFGKERYAVYFLPGTYHSKIFRFLRIRSRSFLAERKPLLKLAHK